MSNICRIARVCTTFTKKNSDIKYCLKYTPLYQRLNIVEFKLSSMKRNLHGIKLSPPSSSSSHLSLHRIELRIPSLKVVLNQNIIKVNMLYCLVFFLWKVSNIRFSPIFCIEFFIIIPRINGKYPMFYRTVFLKYRQWTPHPADGRRLAQIHANITVNNKINNEQI